MAHLYWYLDPPYPQQLKKKVRVGPPLTNLSGSVYVKHTLLAGYLINYKSCSFEIEQVNPFMPNAFSHLIYWTSLFPILGLLGGVFHSYSNFERKFCKQTVENLTRCRILWHLIWLCTVC